MKNKLIFWAIFGFSLLLVPFTILQTPGILIALKFPLGISNLLQRVLGLVVFVLLFWQLMIGAYMQKFTDKLGGWIFSFHKTEGIIIYTLAFLHPVVFLFSRYFGGAGIDPIFVFLGFCLYCKTNLDFYYTLGRASFWLLTVGVLAGLYRAANSFMRANWRKFHVVNYIVFLTVGIHGFLLGSDFSQVPFIYFAAAAYLLVIYSVIRRLPGLFSFYKNWLNS
jgi:predicted ferric reductase